MAKSKDTKSKDTKKSKDGNKSKIQEVTGIDFDISVQREIQSILFIDNKDYENLKYTDKVQFLGKQILGQIREETRIIEEKKQRRKKML